MRSQTQFSYTGPRVPLPVRLLNIAARHTNFISDRLNRLDLHELLDSARRKTKLRDWGDQRFKNALDVLVNSVAKDGELTFFGRLTLRQFLLANLCQRLNIVETCKRFPEIGQQKIQRPIFITGWYRTGSTYLHNLLASHPSVRAPLFWELRYPCPALDPRTVNPKKIIRRTHRISRIHRYLSPGFSDIHDMEAEKPEECLHLFENAILGTTGFFITEAKEYAWWLLSHDVQNAYDFYKLQLQLLNWQRPGQRWLLKWPYHLWHLDALWKTFPDATVVQLHRDPVAAIGSVCSLAASARSTFCARIDNAALGQFWMDYNDAGLRRGFKERESHAANQIVDVRYAELMEDPIAVLHRILESVDLGSDSLWFHSLRRRLKGPPKKKLSRHRYTLSQFGLDPGKIRQRFGGYMADYDLNNV
ncbi:MAG: sulfotransferase [Desulfobacterales bacterium]|jgi:hypothetical protein